MMLKLVFLLTIFSFGFSAHAGISTNGGTPRAEQDNVWYLGSEPIEYCIERGPHFSLSLEDSRKLVHEAITDWITFFKKYNLDQMAFGGLKDGQSLGLTLQLSEVAKCSDNEELLRFSLGTDPQTVKEALASQHNAMALAVRQGYNHKTYRNGGTIWIRNRPLEKIEVKHLLLHELGHVFGMEHDSVYVMDSRIADVIRAKNTDPSFGQIESPLWIYRFQESDTIDFSSNGRIDRSYEPNLVLQDFRKLFGFSNQNAHAARLEIKQDPRLGNQWLAKMRFQEKDTNKVAELVGTFTYSRPFNNTMKGTRGPVLYTAWNCTPCGDKRPQIRRYLDARPSGLEASGSFDFKGTTYPAVLSNRNGILLRIFVTEKKSWWASDSYIASSAVLK